MSRCPDRCDEANSQFLQLFVNAAKRGLIEMGWDSVDWIDLSQVAVLQTNFWVP
jgi:hypothetical protein